jgi:hypothetical protein
MKSTVPYIRLSSLTIEPVIEAATVRLESLTYLWVAQ